MLRHRLLSHPRRPRAFAPAATASPRTGSTRPRSLAAAAAGLRTGSTRPLAAAVSLAALALALAAPSAGAAEYCVRVPKCTSNGGIARTTLQDALSTAAATAAADRVVLGAGVYDVSTGSASQTAAYAGDSALELVGAGADATTLTQSIFGEPSYLSVLTLTRRAGAVTVHDLGIRLGDGDSGRGLRLYGGAEATNVRIDDPAGSTNGIGITAESTTLRNLDVDLHGDGTTGLSISDAVGGFTLEGGSYRATGSPAIVVDVGSSSADVRLHGVDVAGDPALAVRRGRAIVDSSVLRATGTQGVVDVSNTNNFRGELRAILRNATLAGSGGAQQVGVSVRSTTSGQQSSAQLVDSIVTGVGRPLVRGVTGGGSAAIDTDHVAHGPLKAGDDPVTPSGGALTEIAPIDADPGFEDAAAGDLRLRSDSALIDAGSGAALAPDEPDADLLGARRILDGNADGVARRDLGAYELVAPPAPDGPEGDGGDGSGGSGADGPGGDDGAGGAGGAPGNGSGTGDGGAPGDGSGTGGNGAPGGGSGAPGGGSGAPGDGGAPGTGGGDAPGAGGGAPGDGGAGAGTGAGRGTDTEGAGGSGRTGPGTGRAGSRARDRRAPRLTRVRAAGSGPHPLLRGRLDEAGSLTVTIRSGKRTLKRLTVRARAGAVTVRLPARLHAGRYRVTVTAADAAGNRSKPLALTLVRRR